MKIEELGDQAPKWLRDAETSDANVEIDEQGRVVWHGGKWRNGVWLGGVWHGGVWHDGVWFRGAWCGGVWLNGVWYGGAWYGGVWHGGKWRGGEWRGGHRQEQGMIRLVVTEHKEHAGGATKGTKWHTIRDDETDQYIVIESPEDIARAVRQIAADYGMTVAELVGDDPLARFGQGDYETEINE